MAQIARHCLRLRRQNTMLVAQGGNDFGIRNFGFKAHQIVRCPVLFDQRSGNRSTISARYWRRTGRLAGGHFQESPSSRTISSTALATAIAKRIAAKGGAVGSRCHRLGYLFGCQGRHQPESRHQDPWPRPGYLGQLRHWLRPIHGQTVFRCGQFRFGLRRKSAECPWHHTVRRKTAQALVGNRRIPPSPWMGSTRMAAVFVIDGRLQGVMVAKGQAK